MSEFLPCPFCGGDARLEECDGVISGEIRWSVGCQTDTGGTCYGYQSLTTFGSRQEAITAWNKRWDK